jgi:hypothetical protein
MNSTLDLSDSEPRCHERNQPHISELCEMGQRGIDLDVMIACAE